MNKFRREIMWAALLLIIVLTAMSIYGAFIGADRAQMFLASTPTAVFWMLLAIALIGGFAAFRRLIGASQGLCGRLVDTVDGQQR